MNTAARCCQHQQKASSIGKKFLRKAAAPLSPKLKGSLDTFPGSL